MQFLGAAEPGLRTYGDGAWGRLLTDIGHGSIAVMRDLQAALFTIFAGEVDPFTVRRGP